MGRQNDNQSRPADAKRSLDEAESLVWDLLDDRLDAAGSERLTQLLKNDESVRARYIDCVQLHLDLLKHYGSQQASDDAQQKPGGVVLTNLSPDMGSLPGLPQILE